ncbi:hypothetical protein ACIBHY_18065 [Nonomuraea sp. NPDC050547]|uniref:Uncharacterized protein n=1 Tax=Nonomuraea endophytica TaxID=714136 RepID=A0A7W8AEA2_9ACTN|nr:hypothetical protein [Nonomuraea endophytica]MBB5084540.1 hypothetical protein [Nonomuraea endophytica]
MYEVVAALVPPAVVATAFLLGVRAVLKRERADREHERSESATRPAAQ